MPRRAAAVLLLLALTLAGCGEEDDGGGGPSGAPAPSSPAATPPSTPARGPFTVLDGPLRRCGPQPASVPEAGFRYRELRDPAVGTVPAVTLGSGPTAVVLLHQTNGNGLCGWLEFGALLAADPSLSMLAIDVCPYGEAECVDGTDQVDPVALALHHAHTELGAERVVVMGASMGGSVALMAAARLPGVDTAIDLSGPVGWQGMEEVRQGRALPVPVLVAMAEVEGPEEMTGARRIVRNAPAGSELIPVETGHGYELLLGTDGSPTPVAERVISWIAGS